MSPGQNGNGFQYHNQQGRYGTESKEVPEVVTISQKQYQQSHLYASLDRLLSRKKLLLSRMQDMQEKLKLNVHVRVAQREVLTAAYTNLAKIGNPIQGAIFLASC